MGEIGYASIADVKSANGVQSYKTTANGLIAVHKRNSAGSYYWKYYRYQVIGGVAAYYYTGSTSKWED